MPAGESDHLPGSGIELLAIAELVAQPRADSQPVVRIHTEVAPVKHGVDIRSQKYAVVDAVLAPGGHRPAVRSLQAGPGTRSACPPPAAERAQHGRPGRAPA